MCHAGYEATAVLGCCMHTQCAVSRWGPILNVAQLLVSSKNDCRIAACSDMQHCSQVALSSACSQPILACYNGLLRQNFWLCCGPAVTSPTRCSVSTADNPKLCGMVPASVRWAHGYNTHNTSLGMPCMKNSKTLPSCQGHTKLSSLNFSA